MLNLKKIISAMLASVLLLVSLHPVKAASIAAVEVINQEAHNIQDPIRLLVYVTNLIPAADNTAVSLGGLQLSCQSIKETQANTYSLELNVPENALLGKNKLTVTIGGETKSTYVVLTAAEKLADGIRRNSDFTGLHDKTEEYISSALLLNGDMQGVVIASDTDGNEYCALSGAAMDSARIAFWADERDRDLSFPSEPDLLNPVVCEIEFDIRLSERSSSCNLEVYHDKSDLKSEFFPSNGSDLGDSLPIIAADLPYSPKLNRWHKTRVSINRLKNTYELYMDDEYLSGGEVKLPSGNQINVFSFTATGSVDLDGIKFTVRNSTDSDGLKSELDSVFKGSFTHDCSIVSSGNAFNASYELINDSKDIVSGSVILAGYTDGELSVLIFEPYCLRPRQSYIGGKAVSAVDYAKAFLWSNNMTPLNIAVSE